MTIEAPPEARKPPFEVSKEDDALLEEIQRAAFGYLWHGCSPDTGMVYDRSSKTVVSVAGVGFQLSAIPIGVERGWISQEEGTARALKIVTALRGNPNNRKAGLFYHYLDPRDAGPSREAYEHIVSTVDSALLMAGLATASSYFGGEVAEHADALLREADWAFFVNEGTIDPRLDGFISLGWKPADPDEPTGEGELLDYGWVDAGDEHRLVMFLAVCAPERDHRVPPELYYRLRRTLGHHEDCDLLVWFPWSGALFTAFFAHCWIDYAHMGPDTPAAFGVEHRARVDWWENSRRTACLHRAEAIRNPKKFPGVGPNLWGLSASDSPDGYSVPGLFPRFVEMIGAEPEIDFPVAAAEREHTTWGDGTVAPYASGCTIMFSPDEAVAALRYFRELKDAQGKPWIWRDPGESPDNHGLLDSLNIGKSWVADDYVAIDEGPLVLAIENARSGLIWRLFHEHPFVREGSARLRLVRDLPEAAEE